jgi:hypothetical protein
MGIYLSSLLFEEMWDLVAMLAWSTVAITEVGKI